LRQWLPELGHRAEQAVGQDDAPQAVGVRPLKHRQGHLPLRLIADRVGNPDFRQTLTIRRPGFRQIQPGVEGGDLRRRGELQRHRHLATRHLSESPGVLTGHADRMLPLLGEARIVEDEEPLVAEPAADPGLQSVEEVLLVPGARVEQLLQPLLVIFGTWLDDLPPRRHRLDALAVAVEQHTPEVSVAPASPPRMPSGPSTSSRNDVKSVRSLVSVRAILRRA